MSPSALPCPTILGGIWVFLVPHSLVGMSSPGMLNEERDSLGSYEDQIKNGGGAKQRWGISLQVMSFTWSLTAHSIRKPAEHRGAGSRSWWLSHVIKVLQTLFSPGEEKLTRVTVLPSSLDILGQWVISHSCSGGVGHRLPGVLLRRFLLIWKTEIYYLNISLDLSF